jgi:hypothetical protein
MKDSDTHSFESYDTQEELKLLAEVDFELDQFEQKKHGIREDFKKHFGKIFNAQDNDDSVDKDNGNIVPNGLGHLIPSILCDQRNYQKKISENNQTMKMSKESRAAYNHASGEESRNNTQSTAKLSGVTSSSYSLQQIDRIYNKLMTDAKNIPSANVSWKNSSLKTDQNSECKNLHSEMSSIKNIQTNNNQK